MPAIEASAWNSVWRVAKIARLSSCEVLSNGTDSAKTLSTAAVVATSSGPKAPPPSRMPIASSPTTTMTIAAPR